MSDKQEVYREQAELEASPLSDEERTWADEALKSCKHKEWFTDLVQAQIVRGYATYKPRQEETTKCFTNLEEWQEKIQYHSLLKELEPGAEKFNTDTWCDKVYGTDKFGHIVIGFSLPSIKVNDILSVDDVTLERLVGQKLHALQKYKEKLSKSSGIQRYKATMCIDANGIGLGFITGKKKGVIKRIMDIGSEYFPETVWKIYVYNTGMLFNALWNIAKAFIHPITKAKVAIYRAPKYVLKDMKELDGMEESDIPDVVGGSSNGTTMFKIIEDMIAEEAQANSKPEGTTML